MPTEHSKGVCSFQLSVLKRLRKWMKRQQRLVHRIYCVAQLLIPLLLPPKCWEYGHLLAHSTGIPFRGEEEVGVVCSVF